MNSSGCSCEFLGSSNKVPRPGLVSSPSRYKIRLDESRHRENELSPHARLQSSPNRANPPAPTPSSPPSLPTASSFPTTPRWRRSRHDIRVLSPSFRFRFAL